LLQSPFQFLSAQIDRIFSGFNPEKGKFVDRNKHCSFFASLSLSFSGNRPVSIDEPFRRPSPLTQGKPIHHGGEAKRRPGSVSLSVRAQIAMFFLCS
jgi:hypothetical protein